MALLQAHLLLLCFSLLPQILAALNFTFHKPPSLSFLSFLSEGHVQRRPPNQENMRRSPLRHGKMGLGIDPRKRNPPCPGRSYDPRNPAAAYHSVQNTLTLRLLVQWQTQCAIHCS